MASRTQVATAIHGWLLTAFSEVPRKHLMGRRCLIGQSTLDQVQNKRERLMRTALTLESLELPMQPPGVFFGHTVHPQHAPATPLPRVIAHELHQQVLPIDAVGLRTALAAVDFDA
jgi:hypothetical protein